MTQDERWRLRYNEVLAFMEREHRNPLKHRFEEHDMLNWLKVHSLQCLESVEAKDWEYRPLEEEEIWK